VPCPHNSKYSNDTTIYSTYSLLLVEHCEKVFKYHYGYGRTSVLFFSVWTVLCKYGLCKGSISHPHSYTKYPKIRLRNCGKEGYGLHGLLCHTERKTHILILHISQE
jgi:hypothetical protein